MEIYYQSFSTINVKTSDKVTFLLSLLYSVLPWLVRWSEDKAVFEDHHVMIFEILILIPKFTLLRVLVQQVKYFNIFIIMKLKLKKNFLCLLDGNYSRRFKLMRFLP